MFFLLFWGGIAELLGQDSTALVQYEKHLELAKKYESFSFHANCVEEINAALEIAKEKRWKEKEFNLIIFLAEVKRKTEDHEEGLSILYKLENSIDYPQLHVKKLGRMAALFNQMPDVTDTIAKRDSVFHYLDSALKIATRMKLVEEQAGLYNELGYTLGAVNIDSSLFFLKKAAQLFTQLEDTANYVVVQTNIMRTYTLLDKYEKVNPIIEEVLQLIQLNSWNSNEVKLEFYRTLTYYYSRIGDSLKFNLWNAEKYRTRTQILKNANASKLNSFRALYETNKYRDKVSQKTKELEKEAERRKELISYFIVFS
ncbi:MAG: hypothetical protein JKY48_15335, partial [Flavobacteriales bacterium]|nr:hypothetical protein [Flavobacteriales bacterium]